MAELAYNLWWSWYPQGRALWASLDAVEWEITHNPIRLLSSIEASQWAQIEEVEAVQERYREAVTAFDRYRQRNDTWYHKRGAPLPGPVVYLCSEYGLHFSLPFYSGGLGVLAGDHAKAASDLGIPLVGVGLLYRRGYFHQEVEADGEQHHSYPLLDLRTLPIRPVAASTGGPLKVPIDFPNRTVWAAVWHVAVGNTQLLLLDTDLTENHPADRPITHSLYVRGRDMRFCQELVLGVGGIRAIQRLGIEPGLFHVNEGHAALSVLERLAQEREVGLELEEAITKVRSKTIFTLHTPVPAGNETFDQGLALSYLKPWQQRIGLEPEQLEHLAWSGRDEDHRFDLGALAIRHARTVNGVSRRHGQIVSHDWSHLIGGDAHYVTNGVHTPSWVGRSWGSIFTDRFGPTWPTQLIEDPSLAEHAQEWPDELIWSAHQSRKEILVRFIRGRLRRQWARHGQSPDRLREVEGLLDPDRLTIGFARRFASYKRATLMFSDPDRFREILTRSGQEVQIVFAGKAHPADEHGRQLIRHIVELSNSDPFYGHLFFVESYDTRVARFLVQGVDVWLNNPRPPMEASGTSGMKAAINGTLNLSGPDGWWLEADSGLNGWTFGAEHENGDHDDADHTDSQELYQILEQQVIPLFYRRDEEGLPREWIQMMRQSMISSIAQFSAHRMVAEYFDLAYHPLGTQQ